MADQETVGRRCVTILWRIENVSHVHEEFTVIQSSSIKVHSLDDTECYLSMYPMGSYKDDMNICLTLNLNGMEFNVSIDIECAILDSNGSPLITGTIRNRSFKRSVLKLPVCPTQEEVFVTRKFSFLPNDTLTVRCCIWKSKEEIANVEHFSLLNQKKVQESTFLCRYEKFSSLELGQTVSISHKSCTKEKIPYRVELSIEGASLQESKVEFILNWFHTNCISIIMFEASVLGATGKVIKCVKSKHAFPFQSDTAVRTSWSRQEIMDEKSGCLDAGVLALYYKIIRLSYTPSVTKTYYGPSNLNNETIRNFPLTREVSCQTSQQSTDTSGSSEEKIEALNVLGGDLMSLYQEQMFSDVQLCSNEFSFLVHKCVLSARSPVFRYIFSNNTRIPNAFILKEADIDSHTLNRLLIFMYAGTVKQLQYDEAAKLYLAAAKYQVSSLKHICTSTLQSLMTISNVCDILILANAHRDRQLEAIVHDFILSEFEKVMRSQGWEALMKNYPQVAGETTLQLLSKKYELSKKQHSA